MRTPEETRQLVENYVRQFNARDFDAMMTIYAESATLEDPVGSGIHVGKAAVRAFYDRYLSQASFLQLTGDFRYAVDAVAFSFFCYLGDSAEPTVVQITDTFRFDENGLVEEMRAFWGEANVHGVHGRSTADGGLLPLAGKVALIVGDGAEAAACALAIAGKGALVVIAGNSAASQTSATAARDSGGRAVSLPADLADERTLETLCETAMALAGRLDCCVNALPRSDPDSARLTSLCAGEQLRSFHDTTLRGAIVNVVQHDWHEAMPEAMRFGASRAARINSLMPGLTTPPEAIGEVAAWLVSPAAGPIDGQAITLIDSL
jgi:steroid Delta-isomerase